MDISAFRKLAFAGLVLLPCIAACAPDTPETQLAWDANERSGPSHAQARREPPRTYVYRNDHDVPVRKDEVPAPTPRPKYEPVYSTPVEHSGSLSFVWPVTGPVISRFGATTNGERNDGINIATPKDAPIHASASGTVTYSGNELKGYGNLLLIKHADGYVTAYAHADRILVEKGDFVAKGQVIGYSGSTGDVTSPQLHFEIRHDTTPVDPANLLVARNS